MKTLNTGIEVTGRYILNISLHFFFLSFGHSRKNIGDVLKVFKLHINIMNDMHAVCCQSTIGKNSCCNTIRSEESNIVFNV